MGPELPRHWLRNQWGWLTSVPRSRRPRVPDSGIDTGETGGPSLVRVSWVLEDPRFLGGRNVYASTPLLEGRAWAHEQRVGQCSPMTEGKMLQTAPRVASATLGCVVQFPKASGTGRGNYSISPRVTTTMEKGVSPTQPALDGRPALRHPHRFTNTAVPRFDGTVCWQQHKQVFNVAESNGWDDRTAATFR